MDWPQKANLLSRRCWHFSNPPPPHPYGLALTGPHSTCTRRPEGGPPAGGHVVTCLLALVCAGRNQAAGCGGRKQHADSRFCIPGGSSAGTPGARGQDAVISGWDEWHLPRFSQFRLLQTSVSCFISSKVLPCGRLEPRGPAGRRLLFLPLRGLPWPALPPKAVSYRSPRPECGRGRGRPLWL